MKNNEVRTTEPSEPAHLQKVLNEARHQIKNSFQNIISYINVLFVGKTQIDFTSFNKLIRYIRVVSSLNDLLLKSLEENGSSPVLRLDYVLHEVINANTRKGAVAMGAFPVMYGAPRFAATLALVFHELLEWAISHGEKKIEIDIEQTVEGRARITLRSTVEFPAATSEEFIGRPLIELLVRTEFGSSVDMSLEDDVCVLQCSFPYSLECPLVNSSL